MEDNLSRQASLEAKKGLSFLVETDLKRMFFDFGSGSDTLRNAMRLDAVFGPIDYAILSHGHYDHGSGYPAFVKDGLKSTLYAGPGAFDRKYVKAGIKYCDQGLSFSRYFLDRAGRDLHELEGLYKLSKGIYLLQGFPLRNDYEKLDPQRVKEVKGEMVPDDFNDEIILVLESEKGLVVLVACAHRGIVNILDTVRENFEQPIYALVGGLHLAKAEAARIEFTVKALQAHSIKVAALCHCSGAEIISRMPEFAEEYCVLACGDCVSF